MPTWSDILAETTKAGSTYDGIRRRYIKKLSARTKRNTIIYYSGWLQKQELARTQPYEFMLNDADKNGLMATIHEMDRTKGLDLILHTPGGDMAATESLVDYLRSMFGTNMRAIVPQLAMSGGTMMALACKEIIMGKHSSLGPIDPQMGNVPAHAVKEEFDRALNEVKTAPATAPIWQIVVSKFGPAQISESMKVIAWAEQMTKEWLKTGMFAGDAAADTKADRVLQEFGDHAITKSHARHISMRGAQNAGVNVIALEADQVLQDLVLSVHHASIISLNMSPAIKIIENDRGIGYISSAQQFLVPGISGIR